MIRLGSPMIHEGRSLPTWKRVVQKLGFEAGVTVTVAQW